MYNLFFDMCYVFWVAVFVAKSSAAELY